MHRLHPFRRAKLWFYLLVGADSEQITASELSAVRCIVEACASDLDVILERA